MSSSDFFSIPGYLFIVCRALNLLSFIAEKKQKYKSIFLKLKIWLIGVSKDLYVYIAVLLPGIFGFERHFYQENTYK